MPPMGLSYVNQKMYRFAFVMDQQVGLRTQSLNFERVLKLDTEVDSVIVPVKYSTDAGPLSRMQGIPENFRGTMRGIHEIRAGLEGIESIDGALWATWAAKSVLDLVASVPSFLIMDMTPTQMEAMGELYGYSKTRARFLGGWKRRSSSALYGNAVHLFPWNQWVADSLIEDYGVPADKITPVSPGVDIALYHPDPNAKANDGVVRLLFVGGDFIRKGGDLLLRWARSTRVKTPWEIHVVTRDQVGVTPGVTVHTGLANNSPELVQLYQSCDVFVLPTRADCYSLVGMEAMACALPIVITSLGGIPDLVTEGETGFLLSPDDYECLAEILDRLVEDEDLRLRLGAAGRVRAEKDFDSNKNLSVIIECMKKHSRSKNDSAFEYSHSDDEGTPNSHNLTSDIASDVGAVVRNLSILPGNKRRVAMVLNSYVYGGVEEHAFLLASQLPHYGFQPILIYNDNSALAPLTERLDALRIPRINHDVTRGGFWSQTTSARALAKILKQVGADILHIQLISYYGGRVPLLAGRWADMPMVVTHHIAPDSPLSQIEQFGRQPFLDEVLRFISVSEENRKLQLLNMGLPPERTVCIHNGIVPSPVVPDKSLARSVFLNELGINIDAPLIGAIGRIVTQKGFEYLIRAMPQILSRTPDAQVVFIGEGELMAELNDLAVELRVADRIHWMGFRSDAQMLQPGLDVLAMPSLYEGLPLALLESMAAEIPVVAHAVSGIPEAVTDGQEGYLVPLGDLGALAERISDLLNNPVLAHEMGRRARQRVLQQFTLDGMAQKTAALYEDILAASSVTSYQR